MPEKAGMVKKRGLRGKWRGFGEEKLMKRFCGMAAAGVSGGLYEAEIGLAEDEKQSAMRRQRAKEGEACGCLSPVDDPSAGRMDGPGKPEGKAR